MIGAIRCLREKASRADSRIKVPGGRFIGAGRQVMRDTELISGAEEIVESAWAALPGAHKSLLEAIGCSQVKVICGSIAATVEDLRASGGKDPLSRRDRGDLEDSLAAWLPDLRVVILDVQHLKELDARSFEWAVARMAWHEWGHALSIDRTEEGEIAAGPRLLALAPDAIAENIRAGSYRPQQITHELVAEIYAILLGRLQSGVGGQPEWLSDEIWEIATRVMAWSP